MAPVLLAFLLRGQDLALEELLKHLRANASPEQMQAMVRFARQKASPAAIPALLKVMKDEAPAMDNNVCLVLERILEEHPEAECPLDPLLETIGRRVWTSQQKGSQALFQALRKANWEKREEELGRRLIPLLASQRPRVFQAAVRCLQKITGEKTGPDANAWKQWYEAAFPGRKLDLTKAVYELLVVIRPLGDKSPFAYEVNGERVEDAAKLREKLAALQARAQKDHLETGVVIQVSNKQMQQLAAGRDRSLIEEAMNVAVGTGLRQVTVAPEADRFRPPYEPE